MPEVHWTVMSIPFVIVGAVAVIWALSRHKEKKPTDHIFKL